MSRISVNRKKVKLKGLLGIRARLVLLALILVGPLMLDRVRSLETMRAKQVAQTSSEFSQLAEHNAEAQREVISSVQAVLKSAAYIHAAAAKRQSTGRAALDQNALGDRKGWKDPMLDRTELCRT
jgi:hypothetical protein